MSTEANYRLLIARCHNKQPAAVAVTESGLTCVGARLSAGLFAGAWAWGSGLLLPALGAGAKRTAPQVGVGANALHPGWGWGQTHCAPVGDGGHFTDSQWGQLPKFLPQLFPGFPGDLGSLDPQLWALVQTPGLLLVFNWGLGMQGTTSNI